MDNLRIPENSPIVEPAVISEKLKHKPPHFIGLKGCIICIPVICFHSCSLVCKSQRFILVREVSQWTCYIGLGLFRNPGKCLTLSFGSNYTERLSVNEEEIIGESVAEGIFANCYSKGSTRINLFEILDYPPGLN